jgi:hypothetical protein
VRGESNRNAATRDLPDVRHLVIQNGTHNSYECVENLIAEFIDKGSTE